MDRKIKIKHSEIVHLSCNFQFSYSMRDEWLFRYRFERRYYYDCATSFILTGRNNQIKTGSHNININKEISCLCNNLLLVEI